MPAPDPNSFRFEVVRKPYSLPPPPDEPFVMLDVAFAAGKDTPKTHEFIRTAGDRLRLWVDHHEHPTWADYANDRRFVLIPSRIAHACPELVTPEVVERAGEVKVVLSHHDFDGLISAARFALGGCEPYAGADEDARAADSPGRGHTLSARGKRLQAAISQGGADLEKPAFVSFYSDVARAVVAGHEPPELKVTIDRLATDALDVAARAERLAETSRIEAPGVAVLRLEAKLVGNIRLAVLSVLEAKAPVALILEGTPKRYWATAATYHESIIIEEVVELDRGRHDFRFGQTKNAEKTIEQLSGLARRAGLA